MDKTYSLLKTLRALIFVQRLRSKPWTCKSKFCFSFVHVVIPYPIFKAWPLIGRKSVTSPCPRTFKNILEQQLPVCLVTSPGFTQHSWTVQLDQSVRSTCVHVYTVHTHNTNRANNTFRNKIGMSVDIAVVGI